MTVRMPPNQPSSENRMSGVIDFVESIRSVVGSRAASLLRRPLAAALLLGAVVLPAQATINQVTMVIASDGTPGWDPAAGAGFDTGPNNRIVRTNDTFEYLVALSTTSAETNVILTLVLPSGNVAPRVGQPVANWSYLPSQCGTGSSISADGQTLVCHVANIASAGTQSLYFNGTVLGGTPNATQLPAPALTITADSGPAPAPASLPPTLTVSAAPFYDVVVQMSYQGNPKAYAFSAASGPGGEDGFFHRPLIGLVAKNPNGNGNKGVEQLNPAAPIGMVLDISGFPAGAVVDNWHTGAAPNGTPAATGSFGDGCGSPALGSPSTESGGSINMHTFVTDGGPTPSTAATVAPNGGDCAVTGSTATTVSLSMTGTDTTLARRPNTVVGTGAPVPPTDWWVMNKALVLWTPITSYPPGAPISQTIVLGSITGTSISGQPVTGDNPANNQASYLLQTLDSGTANKIYTQDGSLPAPFATVCDPAVTGDCHVNHMAAQQTVRASVRYQNTGTTTQSNILICEIIDRTVFDIGGNFAASNGGVPGTISYGARAGSRYFASTDASSDPYSSGVAGTSEYVAATCEDPTIQWFPTAAQAEAAGGVVYVRSVVPSMTGNQFASIHIRGLILRATYAATILVLSPSAGVRTAGDAVAPGTVLRNRGLVVVNGTQRYLPRDHLLVVPMKTTSRVAKSIIAPITDPTTPLPVGSTVTYRLQPRYSTTFPPSPRTFTVTDVLPPGLVYVPGSAQVGGVPEEPQVFPNDPSSGHTRLVWTATRTPFVGADDQPGSLLPAIEFQATMSQTLADGSTLSNAVAVSGGPEDYAADCVYVPASQNFGGCVKSSSVNVTVQTPPGFRISKTSPTPVIEPGQPFQFQISYVSFGQAMSQVDIPDLIDILPFVGDGSGNPANNFDGRVPASQFNGNAVRLQQVTVPTNDPGMQVYYTIRPHAQINNDPRDPSNAPGGATVWCLASQFGTAGCPATIGDATAVRMNPSLSTLPANTLFTVGLTMDTAIGITAAGDVFQNSVGARSPDPASSLLFVQTQSQVPVRVVAGSIAGAVFVDANQNGTQEAPADTPLANVCIVLTGTSNNGAAITYSMLTAADGSYAFASGEVNGVFPSADCTGTAIPVFGGLPSGTYAVSEPTQPAGYADGLEHAGSAGGTAGNDTITGIVLGQGVAATDYRFTEQAAAQVSVSKQLTAESGSIAGTAEAGETLTYTLTVTNAGGAAAVNHAFYEVLPANTALVSLTGGSIDCAIGTAGASLCTITVTGPVAGGGGSVQVIIAVQVVNPLPAGVTAITNLVTDDTGTTPPGCSVSGQSCQTPPVCDPATDPQHCVVTPVSNDPPVAVDDNQSNPVVGTPTTVDAVGNDSDPNGNLDPSTLNFDPGSVPGGVGTDTDGDGDIDQVVVPGEGTWTVDANGVVTFTPEAGFTGDPTPIDYTIWDTTGLISNVATITINYGQAPSYNMVKTASPAVISAAGSIAYTFAFTNNGNVPLQNLSVTDPDIDAGTLSGCPIATLAVGATASCTATRTVTQAMIDSGDPIVNTAVPGAQDGNGNPVGEDNDGDLSTPNDPADNSATVTVQTDPPVAVDDSDTGVVGQPVTLPVLGNDSDPNGNIDPTTVVIVNPPPGSTLSPDGKTLVVPGEGTWTVDPITGAITFTPEPAYSGDPTPIEYTVTDTTGLVSNPATVTIDYQQRPPVAVNDGEAADDIGQAITLPAVSNDSDPDGDLAPGTLNFDPASVPGGTGTDTDGDGDIDRVVVPGEGIWTVDAAGNVTFTPQAGFVGNPTPIAYTIKDRSGLVSNVATITITYPQSSTTLLIEKRGSRVEAEIGDTLQYTIGVRNVGNTTAVNPVVVDRLPAGFRIVEGSLRVQGATLVSTDGLPGPVVRMQLDRIAPNGVVSVTYLVRVGVGAAEGDGTNRATAECPLASGTSRCANEASWRVRVTRGVFAEEACLVGKVFVDCNGNSVQDAGELGIPGVRMYLEDGTYLISDVEGKYSYCGLSPQTHVLKVDGSTLPKGAILTTSSNRNAGDANSIFVDAKRGELVRADFIEGSCQVPVLDIVKSRRNNGEVRTIDSEPPAGQLQFESRPEVPAPPRP